MDTLLSFSSLEQNSNTCMIFKAKTIEDYINIADYQ